MRNLLLSIFIIFSFTGKAQTQKWPYINYAYAKAYMYNLASGLHSKYQIVKDGKIDQTATSQVVRLTPKQVQKIIEITDKDTRGLLVGLNKCFDPHHAIVFYDKENKPVASLMLCFNCEAIRLNPKKKEPELKQEVTDAEIEKWLATLKEYELIVKELGFPVFNSLTKYKSYSKKLKYNAIPQLKLIGQTGIKQLEYTDKNRFDLSGIVQFKDKVYVVADKKWNNKIYRVDTTSNNFTINPVISVCPDDKIDYEGIDACDNQIYLIEEWFDDVYTLNPDSCRPEKIKINWEERNIDRSNWGNSGLEGLAIDCDKKILYLAKEREPRRIFKIDLKTGEISEPFIKTLGEQRSGYDIADMKYENGYLYILERGRGIITRITTETKEIRTYSFQNTVLNNGKRIFENEHPEYGMAEALLLTKKQIWIGLDNNGDPVSDFGKSLGLEQNSNTVILIFERPEGF